MACAVEADGGSHFLGVEGTDVGVGDECIAVRGTCVLEDGGQVLQGTGAEEDVVRLGSQVDPETRGFYSVTSPEIIVTASPPTRTAEMSPVGSVSTSTSMELGLPISSPCSTTTRARPSTSGTRP